MYKLVGHRGFPTQYPENTLSSIEAAIQAGAKAVEFDVQCSADGTAYIFHDEDLLRLTGHDGLIHQHSDVQLQQLSAHFPERFDDKFIGEPICTLQQMMALLCKHPQVEVFIEPKSQSIDYFGVAQVMNTILRESECLGERRRIVSLHYAALVYARQPAQGKACPNIAWVIFDFNKQTALRAQQLQPNTLCVNIDRLPTTLPKWLNCDWMIYSVDDTNNLQHYVAMGIHYIETNDIKNMPHSL